MPRQARKPRPDPEPALTPEQVTARHLHQLNDAAEKTVEASAIDLRDQGFTSYAAALRGQVISGINVICRLDEPTLADDLKRIRSYVDELIAEIEKPTSSAA